MPFQIEALYDIATQCPSEGGRAVYWAIGLYGQLTGEVLELQECGQVGERAQHPEGGTGMVETISFKISPNPSKGNCVAEYQLPMNAIGEVQITDLLGARLATYPLDSGNKRISIENLPTGFYLATLKVNGRVVQTQKLAEH